MTSHPVTLPLFESLEAGIAPAAVPAPTPQPASRRTPALRTVARLPEAPRPLPALHELWLAVHLPDLALESLIPEGPVRHASGMAQSAAAGRAPRAVQSLERSPRILAADLAAQRGGGRVDMSTAAALAMLPRLRILPRAPERERALLERLAAFAGRFTPRVSIEPPDGLLLEVRGSLGLFGGLEALCRAFGVGCRRIGLRPQLGLAPVPLAALAGARSGTAFRVLDEAQLPAALQSLPLALLRWPPQVLERLAMIGVRTVGAARRLPRAGFARRFGAPQLASLERLLGRGSEPRSPWQARERFRIRRSFMHERVHHDALLQALTPLVEQLGRFLQARQCGVSAIRCRLLHRHGESTCFEVRWVAPEAQAAVLLECLGARLAALTLPGPVRGCELATAQLLPHAPAAGSLWQPGEHGGGRVRVAPFIEQLRARLGEAAVHGLATADSHVPEQASRRAALEALQAATAAAEQVMAGSATGGAGARGPMEQGAGPVRPLWLLPEPEPLAEVRGRPWRCGALHLTSGPERIETGWWSAAVARDYYQATDVHGVRLWIYRERCPPHRWFLHGVTG